MFACVCVHSVWCIVYLLYTCCMCVVGVLYVCVVYTSTCFARNFNTTALAFSLQGAKNIGIRCVFCHHLSRLNRQEYVPSLAHVSSVVHLSANG